MNNRTFYAPGKLMLSGEYFVLKGSKALSLPTLWGQTMVVSPSNNQYFTWKTFVQDQLWFWATFDRTSLNVIQSSDIEKAAYLYKILNSTVELNPSFASQLTNNKVVSYINYPIEWGIGSSSGLITNIARWAGCNPFQLFFSTSNGSGYDVATAWHAKPVSYLLSEPANPLVTIETLNFGFMPKHVVFVYMNQKISSEKSINKIQNIFNPSEKDIDTISVLTDQIIECNSLINFMNLLKLHNQLVATVMNEDVVGFYRIFDDFDGVIKPLGAWGGDFIMAVSQQNTNEMTSYFNKKGFSVVLNFNEMLA